MHAPVKISTMRLSPEFQSGHNVDRMERLEYSVSSGMFTGINSHNAIIYCAVTIFNDQVLTTLEDRNRAVQILEHFATEGNSLAQAFVGHLYAHGVHVTVDLERADEMYELSQRNGNAESDYGFGFCIFMVWEGL